MSAKLAGNEWAEFVCHEGNRVLEMRWLPSPMNDAAFKASIALFVWHAETVRPHGLLVDATNFHHRPGPEMMQWRNDAILPRYGAAGVRRFAFQMPTGTPGTMESGGKEVIDG